MSQSKQYQTIEMRKESSLVCNEWSTIGVYKFK